MDTSLSAKAQYDKIVKTTKTCRLRLLGLAFRLAFLPRLLGELGFWACARLGFCLSQKTYSKFRSKFTIRLPSELKDKSAKFVILSFR